MRDPAGAQGAYTFPAAAPADAHTFGDNSLILFHTIDDGQGDIGMPLATVTVDTFHAGRLRGTEALAKQFSNGRLATTGAWGCRTSLAHHGHRVP